MPIFKKKSHLTFPTVNNVGVMYEMPMELPELTQDVIWQHVNVNMGSLTMMCWIVLPQMIQRRKGAIINLSSSSAVGPLPYMNIYSASKVNTKHNQCESIINHFLKY